MKDKIKKQIEELKAQLKQVETHYHQVTGAIQALGALLKDADTKEVNKGK